jgi:DNA-binding NarL/FixJ family response regulator
MTTGIILADDHRILRDGLRAIIEKQPDMEVLGEAENGRDAVELVHVKKPDIVIMDISMPDMNGIEATRRIIAACPETKVLALSMHADRRYVMEMLQAGAAGYILKDAASEELVHALNAIRDGHKYLCHKIADVVLRDYMDLASKQVKSAFSLLSPREREVLQLIAEGKSTKDIASLLRVSVKTVETYRKQMMDKLGMHSIAELTKYAIREGLITLDR